MGLSDTMVRVVFKLKDAVSLVKHFEKSPAEAMQEMVAQMRNSFAGALERLMETEIELFLGTRPGNKRNGYVRRQFAIKGLGAVNLKIPRDRQGSFVSNVIPPKRRYDAALEKDLALLNLAGLSTRMLSLVSKRVLGIGVSAQEVSNALHTIVPEAKKFLSRPLADRRFVYLYVDGTNFAVRRSTVALEPTLVVIGVDERGCKSVISAIQGDKDAKSAWQMVFADLKSRGLDSRSVCLGIMDGLPGLDAAFVEAFPRAQVSRCWVHKARNVFPRVAKRYQALFKKDWDAMQYADNKAAATSAYHALRERWRTNCSDAIDCIDKDLDALLTHYEFPTEHWNALRTTNPIERVNKEFKRRSKPMETVSPDGLSVLLAFVALRLEYGWATTPITSNKLKNLPASGSTKQQNNLEQATQSLLN